MDQSEEIKPYHNCLVCGRKLRKTAGPVGPVCAKRIKQKDIFGDSKVGSADVQGAGKNTSGEAAEAGVTSAGAY